MAELLVMRHAKSAWDTYAPTDFERPLAARGERDRLRMAEWIVDQGLCPNEVVCSSAVRARDTAIAVVDACGVAQSAVDYGRRYYGAGSHTWLQRIRQSTSDRLLVCGHNPDLDELVELLSDVPPRYTSSGKLMTTAAVAHFAFDGSLAELAPGAAELITIARPREI